MSDIANRLKEEMKKLGISEQKLADRVGMSQTAVHRIVSGKTKKLDIQTISKLSKALGLLSDTYDPGIHLVSIGNDKTSEMGAQDMFPDPSRMTLEQKLKWVGFGTKDIRYIQEWSKLTEEEQDEELKKRTLQNLEKGRY